MNIQFGLRKHVYTLVCVFSVVGIFGQHVVAQATPDRLQNAFAQIASNDPQRIMSGHRRLIVLGRVDPEVPERLATMMWDQNMNEVSRYWALRTLAEIGPKAKGVMPDLVKAMQHKDAYFRLRGSIAILRAGGATAEPVKELKALASQRSDLMVAGEAMMALGKAGPVAKDAIPFLQQVVKTSSNERCRELAAIALGGMGVDARKSIPLLEELLKEESRSLRLAAIRAFGQLVRTCPESVAPLLGSMGQPGYEGHAAAEALIGGGSQVVPELMKLLQSTNTTAQSNAIHTLRFMGQTATPAVTELAELIPLLTEAQIDAGVRDNAITALGNIGPKAISKLVGLLGSNGQTNVEITGDICNAIREIGEPAKAAVPTLIQIMASSDREYDRFSATSALIAIGSGAASSTPKLIDLISDESKNADLSAIRVLGAIGVEAKDAVQTLHEVIKKNRDARDFRSKKKAQLAAIALSKMDVSDESVLELLIDFFDNETTTSINALGTLGPKAARALPRLRQFFSSKDSELRLESAVAVSRIDPADTDVVAVMVRSLTDPQGESADEERQNAIRALTKMGSRAKEALKPLRALLDHQTEVSALAALAIYKIQPADPQALESLILTLESEDSFGPSQAIQALGEIGPEAKDALPKLQHMAVFEKSYSKRDAARIAIQAIDPGKAK